jgi:hypothetical protein
MTRKYLIARKSPENKIEFWGRNGEFVKDSIDAVKFYYQPKIHMTELDARGFKDIFSVSEEELFAD